MEKEQKKRYWSISSTELCSAAENMGMKVEIISREKNTFYISYLEKEVLFKNVDFGENSSLGLKICEDKGLSNSILERNSFPISKSVYVSKVNFLTSSFLEVSHLQLPLVIKPLSESHGNGVMMCINTLEELKQKVGESFKIYNDIIIQEQIEGDEVRVVVVKGEIIIAIKRIPATVIGDGKLSIGKLIEKENTENILRGVGYTSPLSHIIIDSELKSYISKQSLSLDYIGKNEEIIQLRGNSNIGTGGTLKNVSDIIHPSTKDLCIEIASVFGLGISGIDVIAKDISKTLDEQGGIILEINSSPGLGGDKELTGINTAQEVLKRVFNL
ncbi:hypothetical protein N9J72_00085 [Candidatus Gracilibacteria bacterium]|nr:hypothetical protein [Candidatus Gracilibacteria bacterium]